MLDINNPEHCLNRLIGNCDQNIPLDVQKFQKKIKKRLENNDKELLKNKLKKSEKEKIIIEQKIKHSQLLYQ